MSYLYILEIKPLLVTSFENIFSESVSCVFILFTVSFAMQKVMRLVRSHLFIFVFISIAWETDLRKLCMVYQHVRDCLPMFCSRSLTVHALSLYAILSLCVCVVKSCVLTSLIYTHSSPFPTRLAEETVLFLLYIFVSVVAWLPPLVTSPHPEVVWGPKSHSST